MKMGKTFKKIKSILELSFAIAKADFKLRNERSYLGLFWYILNPLISFAVLFFIFSDRLGNNIVDYGPYLLLGLIMFNFFQSITSEASNSLVGKDTVIIKSINFPHESLIISIIIKYIYSHIIELLFFSIFIILSPIHIINILLYLPIFILFSAFIFGFSLILASMSIYLVDLINVWSYGSRMLMFGTPIFYAIENQKRLFYINLFNPLYYYITAARDLILYSKIPEAYIIYGALFFSVTVLSVGIFVFNKTKNKLSELI